MTDDIKLPDLTYFLKHASQNLRAYFESYARAAVRMNLIAAEATILDLRMRIDAMESIQSDALENATDRIIAAQNNHGAVDLVQVRRIAHFSPFYLLSNARRICSREFQRQPNWVLAMELFALGSTSARKVCVQAGIDPDGHDVRLKAPKHGEG